MFRALPLWILTSTALLVGCAGPEAWHRAASKASAAEPTPGGNLDSILVGLFEPPSGMSVREVDRESVYRIFSSMFNFAMELTE